MDQEYFSSKLATLQSVAKKEDVLAAFEKKIATLQTFSEIKDQSLTKYEDTFAGSLDLAPNEDSFQHTIVNGAARAAATLSKAAGMVATSVEDFAREGVSNHAIPDAVRFARERQLKDRATPEDLALLSLPYGLTKMPSQMTVWQKDQYAKRGTNLERIQAWENSQREVAKTRDFFNIDGIVDRRADAVVADQIKDDAKQASPDFAQAKDSWNGGDYLAAVASGAKGVGKLAKSVAGAASDDPATLIAMAAEGALPSLAAGMAFGVPGTVVTAGSYAIDAYQQAVAEYQKQNKGAMPDQDWVNKTAALAASLGVAEGVSDRVTLGAGKLAGGALKGMEKAVSAAEKGAVKAAGEMGLKLAGNSVTKGAAATGLAAGTEYATEGYQTVVENLMQGKETSLEEAHLAGTLGAWGGGGMAAVMETAQGAANLVAGNKEARAKAAIELAAREAKANEVNEAVQTGNVAPLVDKTSPNYKPDTAIGALHKMANAEGVTPEKRQEYATQAKEVFNKLDIEIAGIKSALGGSAQLQADLAAAEKDLASIPASDTANRAEAQELVDLLKEELKSGEMPAEQKTALQARLTQLESQRAEADAVYTQLAAETSKAQADVDVDQVVAAPSVETVQKVRVLSMASPDSVSIAQAQALVDSKNPAVTEADRDFFRAYVEAEKAVAEAKNMGQVRNEILFGDPQSGQKGLLTYRERVGAFMAQGNAMQVAKEMAGLNKFVTHQRGKVASLTRAALLFKQTGKEQHVFQDESGAWQVQNVPENFDRPEGQYVIGKNSGKFITAAHKELKAMDKTVAFLQSFRQQASTATAPASASVSPASASTAVAAPAVAPSPAPSAPVSQPAKQANANPSPVPAKQASAPVEPARQTQAPAAATAEQAATAPAVAARSNEPADAGVSSAGNNSTERQFFELRAQEQAIVTNVLQSLESLFGQAFAAISKVVLHTGGERQYGTFYYGTNQFSLNVGLLENGIRSLNLGPDQAVALVVSHELGHRLDEANGFESSFAPELQPGGVVFEQAKAAMSADPVLARMFDKPVFAHEGDVKVSSELYAQLIATYVLNKELLREHIPAGLDFVEAIRAREQQGGNANQNTDQSANGRDSAGQVSQEDSGVGVQPDAAESGSTQSAKLSVFSSEDPNTDIIRTSLKQSPGGFNGTKRPLAVVPNFLQALAQTPSIAADYLKSALKPEQERAIAFLVKKAPQWSKSLTAVLRGQDIKYAWKNPAEYLMIEVNGKRDFDENTKAAVVAASMAWVQDAYGKGMFNNDESINSILLRDSETSVNTQERAALALVGSRRATAANDLGKRIVQSLGLKATDKAAQDLMPKLQASLGAYALANLIELGVVEATEVKPDVWASLTGTQPTKVSQDFVRLARQKGNERELATAPAEVVEVLKGTSNVVERLFGTEDHSTTPTFEPVAYKQDRVQGGKTKVPAKLREVLTKKNEEKNFLKIEMYDLMVALSDSAFLTIMGALDAGPGVHINNRMSQEAKNEGLMREYDQAKEFINGAWAEMGYDQPIYLQHVAWKNQRVGIENTVMNPQSSKLARHMLARESWRTTVDPSNTEQMDNFKLRVLESFGVKTDKQGNTASLEKWAEKTGNEKVKAAVAAMVYLRQNRGAELSEQQQQDIVDAVAFGGEKLRTLDALKALTDLEMAQGQPFVSDLVGEVDGVTNGPILTNLLLGAAETVQSLFSMINKGGFFTAENGFANYNIYRGSPGVMDLYETTASKLIGLAKSMGVLGAGSPILAFTGQLEKDGKVTSAGRTIIKRPTTALHFGAAQKALLRGMADDFVEAVFATIEDAYAKNADAQPLIDSINQMLPGKMRLDTSMSIEELMDYRFSDFQQKLIRDFFSQAMGQPLKKATGTYFAQVLERKRSMNGTAGLAFGLFDAVRQAARQELMDELVAKGEMAVDGAGKPIWDLSAEQEAVLDFRLNGLRPILDTAMSSLSGDKSGLSVSKTETRLNSNSQVRVLLNKANMKKLGQGEMAVSPNMLVESGPGVAPFSVSIHSFDSAVSHMAAMLTEALNIHDAHVTGLGNYTQVAQNLNKALWDMALAYSPAQAMYESLENTVTSLTRILENPNSSPALRGAANGFLKQVLDEHNALQSKNEQPMFYGTPMEFLKQRLVDAKDTAFQADQIRLGALAQTQFIDQYALEGGQYNVTDADRKAAADKLAALSDEVPQKTWDAVDRLEALLDGAEAKTTEQSEAVFDSEQQAESPQTILAMPTAEAANLLNSAAQSSTLPDSLKESVTQVQAVMENQGKSLDQAAASELTDASEAALVSYLGTLQENTQSTPFGVLGTPVITPEADVAALLQANPEMSAKELLRELRSILEQRGDFPQKEFFKQLLAVSYKALGDDVRVKLVTPQTAPAEVLASPAFASRGWYVPANGTIYVLSGDFLVSGLTAETLIHELVHASIEHLIDNPQTPEQKQAVAELNDLLAKAKEHVQANGLTQYEAAVSDVQELVAWGMTNADFQKDVLRQLKVTSKTKLQNIKDGLQAFVDSLVKLMFPKSKETEATRINGFASLVGNVALLYKAAAQTQNTKMAQGVEATNRVLSQAWVDPAKQIDAMDANQVFEALDGTGNSQSFLDTVQNRLMELTDLVGRATSPNGVSGKFTAFKGKNAQQVWAEALAKGERPFYGKVLAANVQFSEKTGFAAEMVEAAMSEVLADKAAANSVIYKEIEKVYAQAREHLKGKIDPDLYKFLFMVSSANAGMGGKSDYMQRFMALALTHEEFSKALQFETRKAELVLKGKTFMERLEAIWRAVVDWASAKVAGTYVGQNADARLEALSRKLFQIEARRLDMLKGKKALFDFLEPLEGKVRTGVTATKNKVADLAGSKFVRENRFALVQAAGSVTRIVAGDRVEKVMEALSAFHNNTAKGKPNEAMQLMNYIKGPGEWLNQVIRLAKQVEGERKHIINDVAKAVLAGFKDNGAYLTEQHKAAVSAVLLRTGAHSLLGTHSVDDIQAMLQDGKALQKAIDAEIGQLSQHPEVHYWVAQAKGLGWMRVTGWAGVVRQNLNAGNIARLYDTGHPAPANAAAVEPVIERLVSLYGLQYSVKKRPSDVNFLLEVMRTEGAKAGNGQDNGVQTTLELHRNFVAESKAKLFNGSEALHMHGYLPEVHNPHVAFEIARNADEAKELVDKGYVLKTEVPVDKNDPDKRPVWLYALKGGGLPRWQSGAVSTTGTNAKGTQKHGQYYNQWDSAGIANMQSMNGIDAREKAEVAQLFQPNPGFEPGMENRLVPVLNAKGQKVDYRYMMKEGLRDDLLERDNRFEHLLGVMAGSTYDKVASREQNKQLVLALHQMYKKDFGSNPKNFILVGNKSTDPELREIWNLLPSNTKVDIRREWGTNGLWVPKEMVTPLFGYRKGTLSSLFDKENRKWAEQQFVEFSTWMVKNYGLWSTGDRAEAEKYAKRAQVTVRQVEDVWAELVREMKNTIVIKSIDVLWGNMTSNFSVLLMNGVPFHKMVTLQLEGLRAVMDYQRDRDALAQLKLRLDTAAGLVNRDALLAEQTRLEDAIARNPAKELIDGGLLPTIVEDVGLEDDPYSYRSMFTEWADAKAAKFNPHVVEVAKQVYMSPTTTLHKFLNKSTQYSDFIARYALYKHETEKKNPLPKEKALYNASEAFVNYDLPLPRTLQYLDDHGFMIFIKYFFSIQRVIARLMRDKPLQVVNTIALNNLLGDLPMVLDSSALVRIGNNPLSMGALGLPGSLSELATVQAGAGMFK